jgi:hypothetical protein
MNFEFVPRHRCLRGEWRAEERIEPRGIGAVHGNGTPMKILHRCDQNWVGMASSFVAAHGADQVAQELDARYRELGWVDEAGRWIPSTRRAA